MSAADKLEITELLYRYAELIDAGDFDGVGQLLSRATFGGAKTPIVSGAKNIAGLFAMTTRRFPDTASDVAGPAAPGTPKTRHLVLNALVDLDGDSAAARSTFLVVQATDAVAFQPIVAGRYYDRFARDGDGWYFTERKADVEMVGDVSDHLLIAPDAFDR
ncbi:nuclear transport factor 2 family protein [Mycobacterium sp. NBC_00419]|uniref:nuclear transport factor 2 family protein n=1 Tax=Mycobacterium sp. NBC_00419 TaxID=2975989 RepID=UPI002E1D29B6